MSYYTLWVIAFGLSMDAFAVSVGKGLTLTDFCLKFALKIAFCFGLFQALMPLLGYYVGSHFSNYITEFDHWIAFVLLCVIGINMIKESFSEEDGDDDPFDFSWRHLIMLGVATSIDALAMGISFAFLNVNVWQAAAVIGLTTALLSVFGLKAGHWLGDRIRKQAELLGGAVLIAMGIKVLIEHQVWG
ncbi:manganese efflux pump MntP family protein [Bisgaard Taxon 10/6]|uniref:manganese efflux pump MntP n=1 Tax=Exercitatus varius TaxID=67857 RepID=UPI00294B1E24|nr:manganese efflux pump MntP family protein [Exercitatus varius]MDG2916125.1 manganese efflux pump MntP family protein [Exercitatus varius]